MDPPAPADASYDDDDPANIQLRYAIELCFEIVGETLALRSRRRRGGGAEGVDAETVDRGRDGFVDDGQNDQADRAWEEWRARRVRRVES
jgi:hypothetical protein